MIEDLLEVLFSPLGLIYLACFPGGRKLIRYTAKRVMHAVCDVKDSYHEMNSELKQKRRKSSEEEPVEFYGPDNVASIETTPLSKAELSERRESLPVTWSETSSLQA